MKQVHELVIHTDGGSRGNPGPAAIGVVIEGDGETLSAMGESIGVTTNNVAEYTAVIRALEWIISHQISATTTTFFLDSLLVVSQLRGVYKIKHPDMQARKRRVDALLHELNSPVSFHHVRREMNAQADALVNQALDTASFG